MGMVLIPVSQWMWELYYKVECQRMDSFELWCWRRLLRVPWTARRSNQSILKEISPEYSLERLMLKLKLQFFGHLMGRTDSFEKTLMLGKIEGGRRRGQQRVRWFMASVTQWTWVWASSRSWWWTGRLGVQQYMGSQRVRHDWGTELNWTTKYCCFILYFFPSSALLFQDQWIAVSPHSSGNSFITKPSSLANKSFVAVICSYFSSWLYLTRFLAIAAVRE